MAMAMATSLLPRNPQGSAPVGAKQRSQGLLGSVGLAASATGRRTVSSGKGILVPPVSARSSHIPRRRLVFDSSDSQVTLSSARSMTASLSGGDGGGGSEVQQQQQQQQQQQLLFQFQPVTPLAGTPTSPSRSSLATSERIRRWRQLREQNWDDSFAKSSSADGSDGGNGNLANLGWEELAFMMPQAKGFFGDLGGPPSAASTRALLLQRPLRGASASGVLCKTAMHDSPQWTQQQTLLPGAGGPYGDWYGSPLYVAYTRSIEEHGSGISPRDRLTHALQGVHAELRQITEADGAGCSLPQLLRCLEPLWEELRVPTDLRHSAWQGRRPRPATAEEFVRVMEHASALLAFRDATVLVINGLQEHERLLTNLQQEVGPLEQRHPSYAQLQRIDLALQQFLSTWSRRFAKPPWSEGFGSELPPAQFIWRGADALAQIRLDGASLWQQTSSVTSGSSSKVGMSRRPAGPQNCADRAALNDVRGLRALLRSGGGSSGIANTSA